MSDTDIRSIAIVGGGSAGWMAAAALAEKLGARADRIHVIEASGEPPDTGVLRDCEATLPSLRAFHGLLQLDEDELVRRAGASFGLGVAFQDWARGGSSYLHSYGEIGARFETIGFQHAWLRARAQEGVPDLGDYSLAAVAARLGRFARPVSDRRSVYSTFDYGLQLDVGRYVGLLRERALARGVRRSEGEVADVVLRGEDGFIEAVVLTDGQRVEADLYIDASGLPARLIGQALGVGWQDWSAWLPCDTAVATVQETADNPEPFAEAQALAAGWRWRVPVQGRTSAGVVYDSARLDHAAAAEALFAASPAAEPRLTRFSSGRRAQAWSRNCIALGLSAGVLEPVESIGLHLVQTGITTLLALFPDRRFAPGLAHEYNRLIADTHERARDFLALHYHLTARDERFWHDRRQASLPEPLAYKLELFAARGRVALYDAETFPEASWLAVLIGQGAMPSRWDPLLEAQDPLATQQRLQTIAAMIRQGAEAMPRHGETLARIRAG